MSFSEDEDECNIMFFWVDLVIFKPVHFSKMCFRAVDVFIGWKKMRNEKWFKLF